MRSSQTTLPGHDPLADTLAALRDGVDADAAQAFLHAHEAEILDALQSMVLGRIPAFSASNNPDVLPQLADHATDHAREIARLIGNGDGLHDRFIVRHARSRARQHFPLAAMLHAYRCGHRVFAGWLGRAVDHAGKPGRLASARAASAEFAMEYTDAISTVATTAYAEQLRAMAEHAGDQRAELLRLLLAGCDESDARGAPLLRDAGYLDQRQAYCVVLAQSADPSEMQRPERARRMVNALDEALAALPVRRHLGMHDHRVVAVVSHQRRQSGWTAARASLAAAVRDRLDLIGPAAHIGISNDAPSTGRIPDALREAALALRMTAPDRRIVQLADLPLRQLLVLLAGEPARSAAPSWALRLLDADTDGLLMTTLHAYADASMNVVKTALRLGVHPNTVYARLDRIRDLIGQEPRRFHVLETLLIVSDMVGPRGS